MCQIVSNLRFMNEYDTHIDLSNLMLVCAIFYSWECVSFFHRILFTPWELTYLNKCPIIKCAIYFYVFFVAYFSISVWVCAGVRVCAFVKEMFHLLFLFENFQREKLKLDLFFLICSSLPSYFLKVNFMHHNDFYWDWFWIGMFSFSLIFFGDCPVSCFR